MLTCIFQMLALAIVMLVAVYAQRPRTCGVSTYMPDFRAYGLFAVRVNATYPGEPNDLMISYQISSNDRLTIVVRLHDEPSFHFSWVAQGREQNMSLPITRALGYIDNMPKLLADGMRFTIEPRWGLIRVTPSVQRVDTISPAFTFPVMFTYPRQDFNRADVSLSMHTHKRNGGQVRSHFAIESPVSVLSDAERRDGSSLVLYDQGRSATIMHNTSSLKC
ncbi:hypothetical protein RI367_008676 [Sorochytrium milnesiophthora]